MTPDLILSDDPDTRAMLEVLARETASAVAMEQVRDKADTIYLTLAEQATFMRALYRSVTVVDHG